MGSLDTAAFGGNPLSSHSLCGPTVKDISIYGYKSIGSLDTLRLDEIGSRLILSAV